MMTTSLVPFLRRNLHSSTALFHCHRRNSVRLQDFFPLVTTGAFWLAWPTVAFPTGFRKSWFTFFPFLRHTHHRSLNFLLPVSFMCSFLFLHLWPFPKVGNIFTSRLAFPTKSTPTRSGDIEANLDHFSWTPRNYFSPWTAISKNITHFLIGAS